MYTAFNMEPSLSIYTAVKMEPSPSTYSLYMHSIFIAATLFLTIWSLLWTTSLAHLLSVFLDVSLVVVGNPPPPPLRALPPLPGPRAPLPFSLSVPVIYLALARGCMFFCLLQAIKSSRC